jgi:hypothetical protein
MLQVLLSVASCAVLGIGALVFVATALRFDA